jgi:hypothetical protein
MQKSGGCPLFDACGIGLSDKNDFNTKSREMQGWEDNWEGIRLIEELFTHPPYPMGREKIKTIRTLRDSLAKS